MTNRRLVLLGGGHAHVRPLSRTARAPLVGVELFLVSPFERHHYSGMVPGTFQGTYEEHLAFDLRAIAAKAGARFVQAAAERIDAGARTVEVVGESIAWDLVSVDVGSEPAGLEISGVREHAASVRPMSRAVAPRQRAEELFSATRGQEVSVVVAGGGADGIEVALALERLGRSRACRPRLTVVANRLRALGLSASHQGAVVGDPSGWGEEGRVAWMLLSLGHPEVALLIWRSMERTRRI